LNLKHLLRNESNKWTKSSWSSVLEMWKSFILYITSDHQRTLLYPCKINKISESSSGKCRYNHSSSMCFLIYLIRLEILYQSKQSIWIDCWFRLFDWYVVINKYVERHFLPEYEQNLRIYLLVDGCSSTMCWFVIISVRNSVSNIIEMINRPTIGNIGLLPLLQSVN
jgi:hypothetical protein